MVGIHWFRRDLRITDNLGLAAANRRCDRVVPVYVLSDWRGGHRWTGPARQRFLCESLESLDGNLRSIGGRLVVRCGRADDELGRLIEESGAERLYFNRDPDPFGRAMEGRVEAVARRMGCGVEAWDDIGMHAPDAVTKADGTAYRVFTPYWKAWAKLGKEAPGGRLRRLVTPDAIPSLALPGLDHWGLPAAPEGVLAGGEKAARARMRDFLAHRLPGYEATRNMLAGTTTSRLSQDLRFGLISVRELYAKCREAENGADAAGRRSVRAFLGELCWREFYFQILHHFPDVLDREFNPRFRGMEWDGVGGHWDAWRRGETGFPIVDAGMRELATTGFMHNRARMIVAMFLTKDLHLDWRLGEGHFMRSLVDGEIGSNNGGWQWSAGTGADAAPYFRIQNPWTQSKRYDPDGEYIRRHVPELADADARAFFKPPERGKSVHPGYPEPVVDHAIERERTLGRFAAAKDMVAIGED